MSDEALSDERLTEIRVVASAVVRYAVDHPEATPDESFLPVRASELLGLLAEIDRLRAENEKWRQFVLDAGLNLVEIPAAEDRLRALDSVGDRQSTFINELGNKITMGVAADGRRVTITAVGPTSKVEQTWTLLEALTLRDHLTAALGDRRDAASEPTIDGFGSEPTIDHEHHGAQANGIGGTFCTPGCRASTEKDTQP